MAFAWTEVCLALITVLVLVICCVNYLFNYWKRKNVPYIEPSLPFGNLKRLVGGQSIGLLSTDFYEEFKKGGCGYGGVYALLDPLLVVLDLELLKNIMSKDYQYFINRGVYYNEKHDPLAADLFNIGGSRWKNLRTKLSPCYTSGKIKSMFDTMLQCCCCLERVVQKVAEKGEPLDVKEICGCYTTDVNIECSFGLKSNSLENPEEQFRKFGKEFFLKDYLKEIKHFISVANPKAARLIGIVTRKKEVTEFFKNSFETAVKLRDSPENQREDLLQQLIAIHKTEENGFTKKELLAHCLNFFTAGFETSSATMEFCLYEMAENPQIQRKAREEVKRVAAQFGQKITYEALANMKYLGQIVDETLRKYPPVPTLNRECSIDYTIPDTDIVIEKGTRVLIPAYGLHHDPDYFPDPDKFDPDRFSEENKGKIPSYAYLPFGDGPRNCIGLRLGLVQVKVGLATILRRFELLPNEKTGEILFDNKAFLLRCINPIWLNVKEASA